MGTEQQDIDQKFLATANSSIGRAVDSGIIPAAAIVAPNNQSTPLISLQQLSYSYNNVTRTGFIGKRRVVADFVLCDLNLTINRNDRIVISGPSGCGKSTLLKLIAGVIPLQRGRMQIYARDGTVSTNRLNSTMMFQAPLLLPWLTVAGNIAFAAKLVRKPVTVVEIDKWCEAVGLPGLADRKTITLSGGQRQRVALARSLITRPELLLLDEPFSALDRSRAREMLQLVKRLATENNIAIIMVTHNPAEAQSLAARHFQFNPHSRNFVPTTAIAA